MNSLPSQILDRCLQLMKALLIISALTLTLVSCKIQKDTLYGKCGKHYYACTQILLKDNGEFEYFQFYDVGGSTIVKGQWQSVNDTVVLNTYEQQNDRLDTVIESTIQNQKSRIEFTGGFWGYVRVDSTKYNLPGGQNTLEVDKPLKNITFYFYDDQGNVIPIRYNVQSPSTNQLLVRVRWLTTSLILTDLKFIKTRNQLKYIDQPWTKKRTAMKNKQW